MKFENNVVQIGLLTTRGGVEDIRLEAKTKDPKHPRPRTTLLRAGPLKAKDRNARGQGPRKQAQVLTKKRSSKVFFRRSSKKKIFKNIFQEIYKILTIQKIVLFLSRGQGNFRGLEASRPRTSKCVLEAKDVLEDSTLLKNINTP